MNFSKLYFQCLGLAAACPSGNIVLQESGDDVAKIVLNRSIRDVDENVGRGVQETLIVDNSRASLKLLSSSPSVSKAAAQSLSPSGAKEVSFVNTKSPSGGDPCPMVEIINHSSDEVYGNVKVDLSTVHGAVVGDTWFGGLSWSHDEVFVAYVAKLSAAKKMTAVESVSSSTTMANGGASSDSSKTVNKYDFVDDWGEKYVDVCNLGIFFLNTNTGKVSALSNVDTAQYTIGQPQFVPDCGENRDTPQYRVAYTAWNTQPRRLGMIYCYHRPCSIYLANITSLLADTENSAARSVTHHLLSRNISLARSPRAAPDGKSLIFLGSRRGYLTHGGCSELFRVSLCDASDLSTVEAETIVGEIDLPDVSFPSHQVCLRDSRRKNMSFPGIYLDQLPPRCFVNHSGTGVVCSSLWGSVEEALYIDVVTKQVVPLFSLSSTFEQQLECSSIQVLDALYLTQRSNEAMILFTFSSPNAPSRAGMALLDSKSSSVTNLCFGPKPRIFSISNKVNLLSPSVGDTSANSIGSVLTNLSTNIQYEVFCFQDENGIPFEAILITPIMYLQKDEPATSIPLVLVPHGGPHSCFSTAFVASYVYLATSLKSAVLCVNYRGSTGFGRRSIESLAGTIGTNDVNDMMTCLRHVLTLTHPHHSDLPLINPQKIAVCGGSHGGFLGAHLSAQFPETFQVAALRNPVTDIAAMVGVSDIPDWCYVESIGAIAVEQAIQNGSLNWANPSPNVDHLTRMREVSPVHVASVYTKGKYRVPTLICLGMKDRRVPPSQGISFYQLLKLYHGDTVPLSLMTFPEDTHAIDLPATEAEHWIAIAQWFQSHLYSNSL